MCRLPIPSCCRLLPLFLSARQSSKRTFISEGLQTEGFCLVIGNYSIYCLVSHAPTAYEQRGISPFLLWLLAKPVQANKLTTFSAPCGLGNKEANRCY